jgi:hypothetical protein
VLGLLGPTQTSPRNLAPHHPLHATVAQHHRNKQRCFKAINQNRLTSNFDTTAVNCQATIQNCNTVPAKVLICVCSVDRVRMLDERQSVSAHNKDIVPVHNRLKKPSSRKMIQGDKSHTKNSCTYIHSSKRRAHCRFRFNFQQCSSVVHLKVQKISVCGQQHPKFWCWTPPKQTCWDNTRKTGSLLP